MQIGPLSVTWTKAIPSPHALSGPDTRGGWWSVLRESYAGAWQQNVEVNTATVLTHPTVYSCITLIASDIGKLRMKLVRQEGSGVWTETSSAAFSPVLRKPNSYQNRIKFLESWITSKLITGNTYLLKQRDEREVVVGLYVLDPNRVKVLIAEDGAVYYHLNTDNLSGLTEPVIVPQREIIHDVMVPLYHPLVGVSPITACGLAAIQGLRIQENSTLFFQNGAAPSGILSSDQIIKQEHAEQLSARWADNYSGSNRGAVAVLGNGLKYQQLMMSAVDAQLIDQLKWTSETVCSVFHVPPHMVNVGPAPPYNNIEALNQQYYSQCLQILIESIELLLDEGIGIDTPKDNAMYGTELDLDGLLRMDTASRVKAAADSLIGGLSPNEVRLRYHNVGPTPGGDRVFLQRQNWPLEMLGSDQPVAQPAPEPPQDMNEPQPDAPDDTDERATALLRLKALAVGLAA